MGCVEGLKHPFPSSSRSQTMSANTLPTRRNFLLSTSGKATLSVAAIAPFCRAP